MNWTPEELERMRQRALAGFAELCKQFQSAAGKAETPEEKEYAQFAQDIESAKDLYEAGDKAKMQQVMDALKDAFDARRHELAAQANKGFLGKTIFKGFSSAARKAEEFKDYKRRMKGIIFDAVLSIKQPPANAP